MTNACATDNENPAQAICDIESSTASTLYLCADVSVAEFDECDVIYFHAEVGFEMRERES